MGLLEPDGRYRGGDGAADLTSWRRSKTLDDLGDVTGKRVLVRVDLNVPMQDGAISDDTRLRATLPTVTELADKGAIVLLLSHFGRPKGRPRHVAVAGHARLRPSARPSRAVRPRLPGRKRRRRARGDAPGRRRDPRKHPLPRRRGEERPGAGRGDGRARRFLRQRRLLRRAPRPCLDRRPRPPPAGLCRPGDGGGAEGARARARQSRAPGRGGGRRRQGLDQAGRAQAPGRQGRSSDHRRRHGQHLPRRARRRCRQEPVRARSGFDRGRDTGRRGAGELHRPSSLRRRRRQGIRRQSAERCAPATSTRSRPTR